MKNIFKVLLMTLVFTQAAMAVNILRLNIYKSPIGINWNNPKSLSKMTAINTLLAGKKEFGHTLGHLSVSVMCDNGVEFHTGMERTNLNESKNLVFDKNAGLGTLVHNFRGNIENEEKVVGSINHSLEKKNGRDLNFVEFIISDSSCARAHEYYTAFKESKTWLNYGMTNNPRMCEGSGCTAFGKSFLEIVGYSNDEVLSKWRGEVLVPNRLVGAHSTKLYKNSHEEKYDLKSEGNKIKISALVSPLKRSLDWNEDNKNDDSTRIVYYSPDYIYKWIKSEFKSKKSFYSKRKYSDKSRSKIITIDISNVPTPTEPLFNVNCDKVIDVDTKKFN
jgi:hypothetical protein